MANLTLSLPSDVLKKARRVALERDTTVTSVVREHLVRYAEMDSGSRARVVAKLNETFEKYSRPVGPQDWKRDDLYE